MQKVAWLTCALHVRWDGNNGPEQTDYIAMKNLIEATPKSIKRFVLTTSAGVDRSNKLPFNILNLFGGFLRDLVTLAEHHYIDFLHILLCVCAVIVHCHGLTCQVKMHAVVSSGVLKYKKQSEVLLQKSGLPWTLVRPSRLTDGPYTSFDLNTLLQATAGTRQDVQISLQDDQVGEASRIAVAGERTLPV